MPEINFNDIDPSGEKKIPFGKYEGWTLNEIINDEDGEDYLHWLVGESWLFDDLREAIEDFLGE